MAEVLAVCNRRLLVYWMAFLQLEPLPADRDDRRAALHAATLANRFRMSAETPAITPKDLTVDWQAESEPAPTPAAASPQQEADAIVSQICTLFPVGT